MSRDYKWEWVPGISVGGIKFGEKLPNKIKGLELIRAKYLERQDEPTISMGVKDLSSTIDIENGVVDQIDCHENFWYKGQNLLGMSVEDVMSIIGGEWTAEEDNDELSEIYHSEDFDVMVDVEDGVVDSIMVGRFVDDE